MIEITQEAREELSKLMAERPGQSLRLFIQGYG